MAKYSKRIITNCDTCGKELSLTEYRYNLNKHHFCNKECYLNFPKPKNELKYITKKCIYCEKDYEVLKSHDKRYGSKYCSVKCRNKWESENRRGKNHHNFTSVIINCDYCIYLQSYY